MTRVHAEGVDSPDALAHVLAAFARDVQRQPQHEAVLRTVVATALRTVPGTQEGSITLVVGRRKVLAQAASSMLPRTVDALQEEVGQGPCLETALEQHTVLVRDMATEPRWPRFSSRAAELGVRSMLAFQLYVHGDNLGALNLYSLEPDAFDERSVTVGELFAAHAAVACSAAQRESALERALVSRELVGQAQGILMERGRLTADQAFAALQRTSQDRNIKLAEVARRLVETGDLPAAG
jgi:transcriptional regulator with GAF, ATPase, and Fis domain